MNSKVQIFSCNLNEADTLESSSILIYSRSEQSIYTWCDRHDAVLIKAAIKIGSELKEVNEVQSGCQLKLGLYL